MILNNRKCWITLLGILIIQTGVVYCFQESNDIAEFGDEMDDYETDDGYNSNPSNDAEENDENSDESSNTCLTIDDVDLFCQSKEFSVSFNNNFLAINNL